MRNRTQDRLLQRMECPYGAGETIIVTDTEIRLSGQCTYAAEAGRLHTWSERRRENRLYDMGCPRPRGKELFRKPQCPFNDGRLKGL